jgi:hypothetical protein
MAGLLAYVGALGVIWHQAISRGDFVAVMLWSGVAYGLSLLVVYLPVLRGLRRILPGARPRWPFPLVAVLLGVVPTALVFFFNGGQLRHALTPEAMLFYVMFAAVGLVLGLGIPRVYPSERIP